jgi:hypothetical protein
MFLQFHHGCCLQSLPITLAQNGAIFNLLEIGEWRLIKLSSFGSAQDKFPLSFSEYQARAVFSMVWESW